MMRDVGVSHLRRRGWAARRPIRDVEVAHLQLRASGRGGRLIRDAKAPRPTTLGEWWCGRSFAMWKFHIPNVGRVGGRASTRAAELFLLNVGRSEPPTPVCVAE